RPAGPLAGDEEERQRQRRPLRRARLRLVVTAPRRIPRFAKRGIRRCLTSIPRPTMVPLNLKSVLGKLNETCQRALLDAASQCASLTHYDVEVEHWLFKLLQIPNGDLAVILRQYGADASRLSRDLTRAIERFKRGNSRQSPGMSPNL